MSKFNEELVKVEARGFESKGSTEVKTVLMFKDDQHILVYNTIEDYYQKVKAGSFLVGYGVYMNDNTVHVDDNYTWHVYDNYEEVRKYCEQINSNK